MLFDAFRAEVFRILRSRSTVFFSVAFVPLMFAIGGVAFHIFTSAKGGDVAAQLGLLGGSQEPVNLVEAFSFAAVNGANGVTQVFMLIIAATVYAGDYRWETWRLISARNDRISLILGKVGAVKLLALVTMGLFLLASLVFFVAQALTTGRPLSFTATDGELGRTILLALLSFLRIVQYGLIALLTAVATRSLLASLFVPFALGFGQSILGSLPVMMLLGLRPDSWTAQLLLPGLAYDTLKNAVSAGADQSVMDQSAILPAAVSLALWIALPLAGAIALFIRQDIAKE